MPRTYKRRLGARPYKNYTQNHLEEAVNAVRSKKCTLREASEKYGIHRNTLWQKTKEKAIKTVGGQTVFSEVEEQCLESHIIAMSTYGFPVTSFDLRCVAKAYLDRSGRTVACFRNNFPGRDWAISFMKRHQNAISQRTAKNISYSRAATDEEVLNNFFDNLEKEVQNVPASNIWNYDETNLVDDPGNKKILTKRGTKYPEQICNASKACTSIMVCGNTEGFVAPLYVNYKAEKLWSSWTEGGPDGARYNRTKSGWFDHQSFEDWFTSLFLPILKKQDGVKVIIGDNLSSHINVEVLRLCEENNIKFVALPPNSTHLLQPLDVAYFRPMKSHWRQVLADWKQSAYGSKCAAIPKDQFPRLLKSLIDAVENSRSNLKAGFKKSGIYPLDRTQVLRRMPSYIMNEMDHVRSVIGDSFLQKLKDTRDAATQKRTVQRRKKLNVPPGKSIGSSDIGVSDVPPSTSTACGNVERPHHSIEMTCPRALSVPIRKKDSINDEESSSEISVHNCDEDMDTSSCQDDSNEPSEERTVTCTSNKQHVARVDIQAGKYVLVTYEDRVYPGIITKKTANGYMIKAMVKSKKNWKWPTIPDEIEYSLDEIVKLINTPKKMGSRGVFRVPEANIYSEDLW